MSSSDFQDHQGGVDSGNVIKIAGYNGVSSLPSTQRDMYVNHVVMPGGGTDEPNVSSNIQIHDDDLDIRRIDKTGQPHLSWASPSLCDNSRRDRQRSSTLPERVDAELHHLSLSPLIDGQERAGVQSESSDPRTLHPAIR